MKPFPIPVALILFKRSEGPKRILEVIAKVQPAKIYLLADEGRDEKEKEIVQKCRKEVEEAITWPCEVIKYYAEKNRGVFENIGLGAKFVFEHEEQVIFLEDDNLPALSFFPYCQELLEKYKKEEKILWICGTNYLEKYENAHHDSYMFTQHLLPCGWASWREKFLKYYDFYFETATPKSLKSLRKNYQNKALYKQQLNCIKCEMERYKKGGRFASWDYQIMYSLRHYGLYGISPCYNQIMNIGVDGMTTHGKNGQPADQTMTNRFCGIPCHDLVFPLKHPDEIKIDPIYEKKITHIILYPLKTRIHMKITGIIKRIIGPKLTKKIKAKRMAK